jgi:hypothetical protein
MLIFLILTCKTKTLGFQNLWSEHTFSRKQIVSKVTRKYESLLDLTFLKVYPAKFYQRCKIFNLSRRSLNEIPIGSNVNLSCPVAAILDFRLAQK